MNNQHKNLNTPNPDCNWCVWEQVGTNYQKKPVYYPSSYCGIHGRLSQGNTYYINENSGEVFLTEQEMYEDDFSRNPEYHIYDDASVERMESGVFYDVRYEELEQEQKEYLHFLLTI